MKQFIILFFFIPGFMPEGRSQAKAADQNAWPAAYFLDSVKIDFPPDYMNPGDIEDIRIEQGDDPVNKTHGRIYITMANGHHIFLTLKEIVDSFLIRDILPTFIADRHAGADGTEKQKI